VYNYVYQRPPAFKGSDKDHKTAADMLKLTLNPNVFLPTFVAIDISPLPPVGIDHLDVSALMQELSSLRFEVRAISAMQLEMEEMKNTVKELQQCHQTAVVSNSAVSPSRHC